jgi:aminomethyltransferase
MAYVDPAELEAGTPLFIDVRGTRIAASVTPLPFYKRPTQHESDPAKGTSK